MQQESAHVLGLQALGWLAGDPDRLSGFMAASGADAASLRLGATDPGFLAAVLDHLLQDDTRVTEFCDAQGLPYTAPLAARAALPGGDMLHWT